MSIDQYASEQDVLPESDALTSRQRIVGGAAFCSTGVALVIHILTGSPLWLVLGLVSLIAVLGVVVSHSHFDSVRSTLGPLLRRGVVVGVAGTAVYDASRWVLVQVGGLELSPFEALPFFGQALLGTDTEGWAASVAGIAYHLANGVTFGVAFVIWFGRRSWWWGIVFALGLEVFMLALYPGWLDVRSVGELTQVSLVGHFAYGATLGLTSRLLRPTNGAADG